MKPPRFLKSDTLSRCHNSPFLLVQSRKGGFVSQNCLKCSRPDYVTMGQLPKLRCESCLGNLEVGTNRDGNYEYSCQTCQRVWSLPNMLPRWSDLFSTIAACSPTPDVHFETAKS